MVFSTLFSVFGTEVKDGLSCLIFYVNNHVREKILDSDWLRAVLFKCTTSVKSVTNTSYTSWFLTYDWLKGNRKFSKAIWYHVRWWRKFFAGTLKKVFSNAKNWVQERSFDTSFRRMFSCLYFWSVVIRFFSFILELICTSVWVFIKLKLHSTYQLVQFQQLETVWLPTHIKNRNW